MPIAATVTLAKPKRYGFAAALAIKLNKLMGHRIENACNLVNEEIGVGADTTKNWRYRRPLDYAKTLVNYKSIFNL